MKNKVYIVSALMAIMLLVLAITGLNNAKMDSISNVGDNTLSQSTSLDFSKVEGQKSLSEILENSDTKIPENKFYKADDMVSVTVVTGTDSVVESYFQNGKGTLSEYAQSSEGKAIENAMKQEQASVQNAMRNANIIFNNKNAFTTLLNGFSAVVRYGDIKLVKAIKGVVGVSVSQVYSVPATTTAAEKQMMFAQTGLLENNSKYKGEGMVIAILDTGLSYRNPAFQTMPENGAITENYLEQIVPALQINKGNKTFAASEVYVNAKVPYGFDYADNDANVIPHEDFSYRLPFDLTHGTHVAGIAAGDNDVITAAACKAQIACMKVFSSLDGNCYTDSILAALSDSAMLGVDAINMSLGNGCGPVKEHDPASAIINNCYELIEKLGINMCIASGNDTYSTNCTYNDNPYSKTEAPDNGVVGSPASYRGTFSVGSIDNGMNIVAKIDGMNISLNNVMREDEHYIQNPQNFLKLLNGDKGEFDYEIVGGSGKEEDFKAVDVKGKIAVVTRQRRISFTEIATNAQANGAIALIICNNEEGQLNALVDTDLPTATTEMQYGEILKASTNKKISLDKDEILYTISEFSSMGALDNLDIGIDIVAPGGNIYSALLYEMYEYWIQQGREALLYNYMSGTSMASPNFASASMVVSQMIKEKYPQLSGDERTALTYQYVMSTAKIITDINGVPVTPRAQGSGIVDINAALSTDAYLTVTGKDRTKLNLGSDVNKDGIYTLSFNLVNTSDKALSYDVKAIAITEVAENGYMMNKARLFENATFTVDAKNASIDGNVVTVEGGQKANIKVVVTLSTEDKQYMDDNFANGIYVEGYAVLTSNSDGVDLSIPWIAFYGDWDKVPTLEPTDMDHKEPINESMILVGKVILIQDVMAMAHRLGMYPTFTLPEGYEAPEASYDYISLRSDSKLLYLDLNLMRNVPLIEVSVIDSLTGTIYSFDKLYDIRKDYYYNGFIPFESIISFNGIIPNSEDLRWANNQSINLQLKVYRSIENDSYETINFPIFIDNDVPIMTDVKERVENGRTYLDMQVYDNHYLRDMQLWNLSENLVFSLMYPVTNFVKNSINYVSLDITDFLGNLVDNKIAIDF
ncbi:MAG: S8 family serine peptidase, partial [Clostridia bacterium]